MGSLFIFFFQAEDGIRDLVRSRGLGSVYKKPYLDRTWTVPGPNHKRTTGEPTHRKVSSYRVDAYSYMFPHFKQNLFCRSVSFSTHWYVWLDGLAGLVWLAWFGCALIL